MIRTGRARMLRRALSRCHRSASGKCRLKIESLDARITPSASGLSTEIAHVRHEVVLVDRSVPDYQQLVAGILSGSQTNRQITVALIGPDETGLEAVESPTGSQVPLDAIHVITHAQAGTLSLAGTRLDSNSLPQFRDLLAKWAIDLRPGGDLLFYGCNLAASPAGKSLLLSIRDLTGADVAASTDATGAKSRGGNWELEYRLGAIETSLVIGQDLQSTWQGLLGTFTVSTTADAGPGSVRQAILDANASTGFDTIEFAIPGAGPHKIDLQSALPTVTGAVFIDGWTQPGYAGSPVIELNGASAGAGANGLEITGGGTTVRGLAINRFGANGISISAAGGNAIVGNYIGTDISGTVDLGNSLDGISIDNSANNTIGGLTAAERNVISGNNIHGVRIIGSLATINSLMGNYIGLNAAGIAGIGNTFNGIWIANGATNNVVGGTLSGAGNVISGNTDTGVELQDSGTSGNRIEGNIIGLDASGTSAIGNRDGVNIEDAPNNIIGGTTTAHRNIISGNADGGQGNGVVIFGTNATGNLVQNNYIGTDITGDSDLGNSGSGIVISEQGDGGVIKGPASSNTIRSNVISGNEYAGININFTGTDNNLILGNLIGTNAAGTGALGNTSYGVVIWNGASGNSVGGTNASDGNIIAFNGVGVVIDANTEAAVGNPILGNSIHDNLQAGIDLNNNGVTFNDTGDGDNGGNRLQNSPVISSASTTGTKIQIAGTLNSTNSGGGRAYRIEFFANSTGNSTGYGEGQRFLGFASVLTNGSGNGTFNIELLASVSPGEFISATATDLASNDTSEFAQNQIALGVIQPQPVDIGEFRVNSTSPDFQVTSSEGRGSPRAVAAADDGSYVVVWSSNSSDPSGWGVYGQRFDSLGTPIGGEFSINQTTANNQYYASIAMSESGSFVVTWTSVGQDGSGNGVYARRYDAAATALGNEFRVNTTTAGDQDSSVAAMAADGRFLVVWEGNGTGDIDGIFGRWYSASGVPIGSELLINSSTANLQGEPSVAMAPDGKVVVVWDDSDGVWAQRFDSSGAVVGGPINVDPLASSGEADVALAADGSFAVAWRATAGGNNVYLRRYDSLGVAIGPAQIVNATTAGVQTNPSLAMDESGSLLVVWEGRGSGDSDGVFGQRFDSNGTALGSEFLVNQTTAGSQSMASAAMFDSNSYVVVWSGAGPGDSDGVFARQISDSNTAPLASPDTYSVNEDIALGVSAATGVLSNDVDADGDTLTAVLVSGPTNAASFALNPDGSFSYTPNPNFNGTDSFSYLADDGSLQSNLTTVTISVNPVNDAPSAGNDSYTIDEENSLNSSLPGVLGNDFDVDGDSLTAVLVTGPSNALAFTLNPDGSISYTPNTDFHGTDSFTYRASDGSQGSNLATVTITVNPVNDLPIAVDDNYSTSTGFPLLIPFPGVLANDVDVDGDAIFAILVSSTTNGLLSFNSSGSFLYTPNISFIGTDSFTYQATDLNGNSNVATVRINVGVGNSPPNQVNDLYAVDEDLTLNVSAPGVLANDVDANGDSLSAILISGPSNGSLSLNSNGSFTYTPNSNFNGTDSFTYRANDGTANSNLATVLITVNAVNDAPVGSDDSFTLDEDTSLNVPVSGVLGNDSDVDGDRLAAALVSGPSHGSLSFFSDGSFRYTPNPDFNGVDTFTYRANDGSLDSNIVTVTLFVSPVNDAPVAIDDSYNIDEDGTLIIPTPGVLSNDQDAEGDSLSQIVVRGPANGTLTANLDGSFAYVPNANYHGVDSFTYRATDGSSFSNLATVTIIVRPVNDAPRAISDFFTTNQGATLLAAGSGVMANDFDVDGDVLKAVQVTSPLRGTLVFDSNGQFTYTPARGFSGFDTFLYRLDDGTDLSNIALVVIRVVPNVVPDVRDDATPKEETDPNSDVGDDPATPPVLPPIVVDIVPTTGGGIDPVPVPGFDSPPIVPPPGLGSFQPPTFAIAFGSAIPDNPAPELGSQPIAPSLPPPVSLPVLPTVPLPPDLPVEPPQGPVLDVPPQVENVLPAVPTLPTAEEDRLITGLGELDQDVHTNGAEKAVAAAMVGTGFVASAGYVLLHPRLALWLFGALAARRAVWKPFDPLDVVYAWEEREKKKKQAKDEESLASMIGD